MDTKRWKAIEDLFLELEGLPSAAQREALEQVEDAAVRREVEELLAADGTEIEAPLADAIDATLKGVSVRPAEMQVERYELLEEIGRGGMGTVFLARRDDQQYHMRVAVKVARHGVFHSDIRDRMRQERHILAGLDHPNICKLLDGGTTEQGMPYFVMEYIEGEPIDVYCERHGLSVAERIRLFRQICGALHYAHRQLVIHRDLKPSNILVTAEGVPKLLDFGIAKLLDDSAETGVSVTTPLVTRSGVRLLTPAYASPEQLQGQSLSTASDVYSLGVLLFRLLTDRLPYRLEGASYGEMERLICEHEPPLASSVTAESSEGTVQARSRQLLGDLDNIVAMALRKEPETRYASVDQLADDLDRHTAGEMVRARPHTLTYRTSKFIRRNLAAVIALSLIILSLTVGLGIALWQARVAAFERQKAEEQREVAEEQREVAEEQRLIAQRALARAESATELTIEIFEVSDPSIARGNTVTVREVLDTAVPRIRNRLPEDSLDRADLLAVLGRIYQGLGLYGSSDPLLQEALKIQIIAGTDPLEVAARQNQLGELRLAQGQPVDAESYFRKSLVLRRQAEAPDPRAVAESLINLGAALFHQRHLEDAEVVYLQGLELLRPILPADHEVFIEPLSNLGVVRWQQGRLEEAEAHLVEALAISRNRLGDDHPKTVGVTANLATLFHSQKKFALALPLAEQVLEIRRKIFGEFHDLVAMSLNTLAVLHYELGHLDEAESLHHRAIAIKELTLGNTHPSTISSRNNLAYLLLARGDATDAASRYEDIVVWRRQSLGDEDSRVLRDLGHLADAYLLSGQLERAVATYEEALNGPEDAQAPSHRAMWSSSLAATLLALGRVEEGRPHLQSSQTWLDGADAAPWQELRIRATVLAFDLDDTDNSNARRQWQAITAALRPQSTSSDRLPPRDRLAMAYLLNLLETVHSPQWLDTSEIEARMRRH